MTIDEILALQDIGAIYKELTVQKPAFLVEQKKLMNQFDNLKHDVHDTSIRQDDVSRNEDGSTDNVPVARISLPLQKLIVKRRASFLIGDGIEFEYNTKVEKEQAAFDAVMKIWDDNKLDYRSKTMAKILFSECEVAELWYDVENPTFWQKALNKIGIGTIKWRTRMRVLAQSLGDMMYPHYDMYGDLDAFCREYYVQSGSDKIRHFDVYTAAQTVEYIDGAKGFEFVKSTTNNWGKIPVIYYRQETPDWYDVQPMIDRLETLLSNFADTNDYFGAPIVLVNGKIISFAKKGKRGKMLNMENGATAQYLTWNNAPEAIKLEIETLINQIYTCSQTADISFSQMVKLGNPSGTAIKLMFTDAHLAALDKQEVFGEGVQRRLNLLKTIVSKNIAALSVDAENIQIKPIFTPYMPNNEKEYVDMLVTANGGKPIISQETSSKLSPLTKNSNEELSLIQDEENAAVTAQTQGTVNY